MGDGHLWHGQRRMKDFIKEGGCRQRESVMSQLCIRTNFFGEGGGEGALGQFLSIHEMNLAHVCSEVMLFVRVCVCLCVCVCFEVITINI